MVIAGLRRAIVQRWAPLGLATIAFLACAGGMTVSPASASVRPANPYISHQRISSGYSEPSWVSSNSGGANLRTCGSTKCQSEGYMRNGTHLRMMCWEDTQWVYPPNSNYASPRWFKIGTLALGGSIGFIHSSLVAGQTSVPHC